jgi:hypothetical protein
MFVPTLPYFSVRSDPPMFEVFALGAAVLVTVTLVHGAGLDRIVRNYRRGARRLLEHADHPFHASLEFGLAVLLMLVLHLLDMCIWAAVLNRVALVPDLRSSLYFTANSYTTLGYGNVPLGLGWRELSPIMAISGLFTFGWTTSVMFNVVGYQHDLVDELSEEYARKMQMRRDLLSEVKALRHRESAEEKLAFAAERQEEAGKSFFQRFRMRREARNKLYGTRTEAMRQAAEALRKEREAESKLYQPPPPPTPKA